MDIGQLGLKKHHMKILIEGDVTQARALIRESKAAEKPSFTAWILYCIAQAVSEHKAVHALRESKNNRIIFDEVDISVIVEKEVNGEKVPLPIVIRNANAKNASEIALEIRAAKNQKISGEKDYVLGESRYKWGIKVFVALPQFLRLLIWRHILKNPFTVKDMMGTVLLSSIGMAGNIKGWAIPAGIHPLSVALGSVIRKPGVQGEQIEIREYLPMTIVMDHDVVDGAPAARFVSRLTELIESGQGL
jgi:pyruvate/2-oxoglutarate dehydrogenase complex dihydrolipoamide acyltransferase (E2) component